MTMLIVPAVIAIIAVILMALIGGFQSFMNWTFLIPVAILGLITLGYGHPYDWFSQKASFDFDRLLIGSIASAAGMLIGCLLRYGANLVRRDEPAVLPNRPGDQHNCRVIRCHD